MKHNFSRCEKQLEEILSNYIYDIKTEKFVSFKCLKYRYEL